jgi:tetratricopeptide (TPR) repeat protein
MKSVPAVRFILALVATANLPAQAQSAQPSTNEAAGRLTLSTKSAEAKAEFWKGMEDWQTGAYTSATRHFGRAHALDKDFALARLLSMGERDARENPADRDRAVADAAHQSTEEGLFALMWREKSLGDAARTRAMLAAAMQLMPNEPSIATEYLWISNGDVKTAKQALDSAPVWRSRFATYTPIAFPISYLNLSAGDTAAAVRAAEEYARIAPASGAAFGNYGFLLQQLGRYDEAEVQYKKGIALPAHPDYGWDPSGALAEMYMLRGRYTDARAVTTQALSQARDAGDSALYMSELAGTHFATGDNSRGMQLLEQARAKSETIGSVQNPVPLDYILAEAYAVSGNANSMRSHLGRIRTRSATDSAILAANYAFGYAYVGQLDSALAYSDRLANITTVPWSAPWAHRARGVALVAARQCARAQSELTQAADTASPQVRLARAECEVQSGNRAAALAFRDHAMTSLDFAIFGPASVRDRVRLAQLK